MSFLSTEQQGGTSEKASKLYKARLASSFGNNNFLKEV